VPSDPEIVTAVAFVADTVKVDEAPAATEVGLALIETVGAAVDPLKFAPPPQAVINAAISTLPEAIVSNRKCRTTLETRAVFKVFLLLVLYREKRSRKP
jgi:hypothetical protein